MKNVRQNQAMVDPGEMRRVFTARFYSLVEKRLCKTACFKYSGCQLTNLHNVNASKLNRIKAFGKY